MRCRAKAADLIQVLTELKNGLPGGDPNITTINTFAPDVLEVLLDRIPSRGGFQNVRGALGFLARLVKLTHTKADLITPAHADLLDQEIGLRLSDLDPSGDLIRKARHNLTELAAYPLVREIGSAAMLFTVSGTGRERGASREHLIRAVCGPATDINEFERALVARGSGGPTDSASRDNQSPRRTRLPYCADIPAEV